MRAGTVSGTDRSSYIYYHCTGKKGKCDEPYTREEVLEECFADLLKGLVFDDQVMDWIVDALHQSHADEKRSSEKRKLLNFVCSNSIWKDHTLTTTFRQPFDLLAITNTTWQREKAARVDSSDLRPIWLPTLDNLRNFLLTTTTEVLSFFQQLREIL